MCSIIGYKGQLNAAPLLVESLKQMEYRGYDSVGIAIINNGKVTVTKGVGNVSNLTEKFNLGIMPGHSGIGHTRWATHGRVTEENAHPHHGCTNNIAIVHNGVIENHRELRDELIRLGHRFKSDTDSEVIAHLLESYYAKKDIKSTTIETCRRLNGAYAFVAAFEDGRICGSRCDQPLIIGSLEGGYFISSDVLGFLKHTDKAIFLHNRDIAIIDSNALQLYDFEGNAVNRETTQVAWEVSSFDKGKYAFHTLKEIHEQPMVVEKAGIKNLGKIEEFCNIFLEDSRTVYITASGTSYHCALIAKYLLSNLAKIHCETIVSSEFPYTIESIDKSSVLLAISQSGETADVLEAARAAKQIGSKILSIVNVPTSSLARMSDSFLEIECGPEVGVAATKSFTAQLSLIYAIVDRLCNYSLGFQANKMFLAEASREVLSQETKIQIIADKLRQARDIYVLGRSIHYPIALEGALKIKELSYIHAEGIVAGELKHGPLALIDKNTYVVIINPDDRTQCDNIVSAREIKTRGATIIGISNKPDETYDILLKLPFIGNSILYPIIEVLPLQILAYYLALIKNIDPDYPRNLAKSVTVK